MSELEKVAGAPLEAQTKPEPPPPAAPPTATTPAPAPAPAPQVVTIAEPAPQYMEPPPPAPTPQPSSSQSDAVLDELRQELHKAQQAREALEQRDREMGDRERLQYLRKAGAVGLLTDEQLLQLAPTVDARKAEGRDALASWAEQNAQLFAQQTPPTPQITGEYITSLPTSRHGVFGHDFIKTTIENLKKGGR